MLYFDDILIYRKYFEKKNFSLKNLFIRIEKISCDCYRIFYRQIISITKVLHKIENKANLLMWVAIGLFIIKNFLFFHFNLFSKKIKNLLTKAKLLPD